MRKVLFTFLTATSLFTACKKEAAPSTATSSEYPISYKFQSSGNISAIHVFTKTEEINAPNHIAAQDSVLNHFDNYLNELVADLSDLQLTLINSHQMVISGDGPDPDTANYSQTGDYISLEDGEVVLKKTSSGLTLTEFYSVTYRDVGTYLDRISGGAIITNQSFKTAVQADMAPEDTTAARTYDLVFKKQ